MLEFALQCHKGMTIHQYKKRCSRLKNIIFCRVEEPENNIHHDQEGSDWNKFTNFFKNVKYNILGVTVKATIVWAVVYVIAIIINSVGDNWQSSCEEGKFFSEMPSFNCNRCSSDFFTWSYQKLMTVSSA